MIKKILGNIKNNKQNLINSLKRSENPVIIYGAGQTAERMTIFLKKNSIDVLAYFVDEEYYIPKQVINNIEVVTLKEIDKKFNSYNVVFGFYEFGKAKKYIDSNVFTSKGIVAFFDEAEEFDYEYVNNNLNEFEETYNLLCDDLSKEIYIEYLKSRLSGSPEKLVEYNSQPQYFTELIDFTNEEIFVDCGSYDGDTIFQFHKITNGKYKKIYAFEPGDKNYKALCENTINMHDVNLIKKGVWKNTDILRFTEDGTSSNISDKGDIEVDVSSIDDVVGSDKVTFIKMDIEGSELMALEGSKNTIKRCLPKLAICVYHKKEDMITIPQYISQFNLNERKYDIYLRHHSLSSNETVLYAIPTKNRY